MVNKLIVLITVILVLCLPSLAASFNPKMISGPAVNSEMTLKDLVALTIYSNKDISSREAWDRATFFMEERAKHQ